MELIADLTLVLLAGLIGGVVAHRLRQPLIVGYILAGVIVGPQTGGFTVSNLHDIEQLAEVGVALLLFSLGLELSFSELAPVRRVALIGGTLQITATIGLGILLALALGWDWQAAMWFGALVSLSSTMVVLKTIQAQGRLGTLSSRVMLGILVVQDLAVVPLMILLPELSTPEFDPVRVVTATGRAIVLLGAIILVSTRVVPRVMALVARGNSRELFLLTTTAIALGVGLVAWLFGLSLALGAFVAGLVISESDYAHQALSDVMPLRDIFGMVFFLSVGMLLDPMQVWDHLYTVLAVVVVISIGKGIILAALVWLFGYVNVVPLAVGLTLFQVGEFAFVLARAGLSLGVLTTDVYAIVLNTAIVTMVLTPIVSGQVAKLYAWRRARRPAEAFESLNIPRKGLDGHIVVVGAGRVGRSVVDALVHLGLPSVVIELNDRRVTQARDSGLPVIYGDASQAVVLEAARIGHARALLVTVPSFPDVRSIVQTARRLRPDLPIVARADSSEAVAALRTLHVNDVASPEFEAGIEMTRQGLAYLSVPAYDILRVANHIRRDRYGPVSTGQVTPDLLPSLGEITRQLDLAWLHILDASPFVGRSLKELRVRTTTGASVVGLRRRGEFTPNPEADVRFEAGDLVAALGTPDQIARLERAAAPPAEATAVPAEEPEPAANARSAGR